MKIREETPYGAHADLEIGPAEDNTDPTKVVSIRVSDSSGDCCAIDLTEKELLAVALDLIKRWAALP